MGKVREFCRLKCDAQCMFKGTVIYLKFLGTQFHQIFNCD